MVMRVKRKSFHQLGRKIEAVETEKSRGCD